MEALRAAGCERVFEDNASGAALHRPNLTACSDYLRQGAILIDKFNRRGIGFRTLNLPPDTITPGG